MRDLDANREETPCPAREGTTHCAHWYDGEACCGCGDPADPSVNDEIDGGGSDG